MMTEDIKSLREKHKVPNVVDLKNKLQDNLSIMKINEEKQAQKLAGKKD